ncbi:hypothetical protein [Marinigracilibium pacificum]|uniref:Uncharacterized protein n=1 Tax=Marinigracilibium pacificum TaxID=2729599 RepID=A0A848J4Y0_9BACT|nr:hypothetical protein [Marinigracilibium pacificum]NMM50328.1 hypothetical protein [Marinigracilibium pacificum]
MLKQMIFLGLLFFTIHVSFGQDSVKVKDDEKVKYLLTKHDDFLSLSKKQEKELLTILKDRQKRIKEDGKEKYVLADLELFNREFYDKYYSILTDEQLLKLKKYKAKTHNSNSYYLKEKSKKMSKDDKATINKEDAELNF